MLQRSDEWFDVRLGRFTASMANDLLGKITLKTTLEKIANLAMKKAGEMYFGKLEEDVFLSKDVQRGIDLEPMAFNNCKDKMALDFIEVNECGFYSYGEHAGASPDGLVGNDAVLEIKCPTLKTFNELVITNEINTKYYAQMQMQMLCTNRSKAYFHNYVIHNGSEISYTIEVERDELMISELKERINYAAELKLQYFETLKNRLR